MAHRPGVPLLVKLSSRHYGYSYHTKKMYRLLKEQICQYGSLWNTKFDFCKQVPITDHYFGFDAPSNIRRRKQFKPQGVWWWMGNDFITANRQARANGIVSTSLCTGHPYNDKTQRLSRRHSHSLCYHCVIYSPYMTVVAPAVIYGIGKWSHPKGNVFAWPCPR